MAVSAPTIETRPVNRRVAASIEAGEARAWADLYAAAPAAWAASAGVSTREVGGALALSWAATGRRYFSRVIGLGVTADADEATIDDILEGYERYGITAFLFQSLPQCRPADYERWLLERGLEEFDRQDRVIRDGRPLVVAADERLGDRGLTVECVTRRTAEEWVDFIEATYRLDTGPWLPELIDRRGWHQYVAREDGYVVGARGMYIGTDGVAWLGMDGPVPGLMTDDYELDAALCEFIVADGLVHGAGSFLTDIEVASPGLETPGYATFARLGFRRPYVRTHYAKL